MELEKDEYDVVIIGTGLAESIAAASLAKAGKSVLHLDPNEYYGGEQASLTLDELQEWCQDRSDESTTSAPTGTYGLSQRDKYGEASTSTPDDTLLANRRRYALSLFPAVLPSRGPLITTLISSGVSKYVSFRMLDSVSVWQDGQSHGVGRGAGEGGGGVRRVPGSKEQVFKDKDISLMEKRRLMKFLMFAVGDYEDDPLLKGKETAPFPSFLQESFALPARLATQVAFAISHCPSSADPTIEALRRTRRYLKSIGRYGSGAFLVGQYGGAGEIAQGFCRACAVFGGTYVLGKESIPEAITVEDETGTVKLKLPCHPRQISAKHLISSPGHLPTRLQSNAGSGGEPVRRTAHCISLLDELPEALRRPSRPSNTEAADEDEAEDKGEDDTAIVVFPPTPEDADGKVVKALMMGEGTGSCPAGQYVLYLSREISSDTEPAAALESYLARLAPTPLFQAFYASSSPSPTTPTEPSRLLPSVSPTVVCLDPYTGPDTLTEGLDWEAEQGEAAFWAVMGGHRDTAEDGKGFFDKTEADEAAEDEEDL